MTDRRPGSMISGERFRAIGTEGPPSVPACCFPSLEVGVKGRRGGKFRAPDPHPGPGAGALGWCPEVSAVPLTPAGDEGTTRPGLAYRLVEHHVERTHVERLVVVDHQPAHQFAPARPVRCDCDARTGSSDAGWFLALSAAVASAAVGVVVPGFEAVGVLGCVAALLVGAVGFSSVGGGR